MVEEAGRQAEGDIMIGRNDIYLTGVQGRKEAILRGFEVRVGPVLLSGYKYSMWQHKVQSSFGASKEDVAIC